MSRCEDCGSKVFRGRCSWCHEVETVEEQYHELDMVVPRSVSEDAESSRKLREEKDRQRRGEL